MNRISVALLALVVMLGGCMETPGLETASRQDVAVAETIVESVDLETRQILLTDSEGQSFVVIAGPEVRNLAQLEAGDVVRISQYEAVIARMADQSDPGNASKAVAAGRAPEGAKPGATTGVVTTLVVDFISYDPNTAIATFAGPDGIVYTSNVRPEMREFAEARKSGDRIELIIEQAVAVSVSEVGR